MRSHLPALTLGLLPLAAIMLDDQAAPPAPAETPIELGDVAWHRNLDEGREHAARTDKPVLLVFQEVPG